MYAEVERNAVREEPARPPCSWPVHGIEMQKERVELGDGLMLVRGDRTDAPDEAVWGDERQDPAALLVLTREVAPDDPVPLQEARMRFRRMLTCLRLWKAGGIALAAVAWRRTGDGPLAAVRARGHRRGPRRAVDPDRRRGGRAEPVRRGDRGRLARRARWRGRCRASRWAAAGGWSPRRCRTTCWRCARSSRATASTGRSSLALRVAVLCAEENERKRVQRRIELAQALERFVMGDGPDEPYLDAVGLGLAADAGRRGGAPPARAAARRDVRLPGCRSAVGGRRAAAGARRSRSRFEAADAQDLRPQRWRGRRSTVDGSQRLRPSPNRRAEAEPSRPSSTTTPPASPRRSSFSARSGR